MKELLLTAIFVRTRTFVAQSGRMRNYYTCLDIVTMRCNFFYSAIANIFRK